ncbi:Gfo/Idh/MocA family protein [Limibacterium fermenti]|uniref:Gfo/Idh/MocA family protein n=1 Tax=Limibacterium fermenti TaxID=3229863 RepID=UPI003A5EB67C
MNSKSFLLLTIFFAVTLTAFAQKKFKIGIIGLDTSHSVAFTKFINGEGNNGEFKDFAVVAAYPYGSRTIKSSYERIPQYIEDVKKEGVEITSSIAELLEKVEYVLLETNDGRVHLEQANEVFKSGKRVFIDKPIGATLAQSIAIFELAKKYHIPVFSSSALRFVPQTLKIRNGEFGNVTGADCYSPHKHEPTHPDFGFYGLHGVETLFTVMGTGCVEVSRMSSPDNTDVVVGKWKDGRIGTFRGIQKGRQLYGGTAFTDKEAVPVGTYDGYQNLLVEILKFFKTGVVPVDEKETLEIFTFMEASNESQRKGGKIISMEETYRKAEKEARKLIGKL